MAPIEGSVRGSLRESYNKERVAAFLHRASLGKESSGAVEFETGRWALRRFEVD